ncbi:hypothetical protein [Sinobaca sp. H24]|uniref:hypothetical protein n=1 Tax=Sinobaca sp. H24 TaxID=2923376 RepID=UPI00207A67E4|nr:hypothetical protein [Sinobaca sp. H24]
MLFAATLSESQLSKLKKALGLEHHHVPVQNFYYGSAADEDWQDLMRKGFAHQEDPHYPSKENMTIYYVSFEAILPISGQEMSPEEYYYLK